jgi:DNA (cytosine-5)-methyltransferase 1
MSARETARLMGLPETYRLPPSYSAACHLTGDGVAVPVVRHLAHWLLEPLLAGSPPGRRVDDALAKAVPGRIMAFG